MDCKAISGAGRFIKSKKTRVCPHQHPSDPRAQGRAQNSPDDKGCTSGGLHRETRVAKAKRGSGFAFINQEVEFCARPTL